MRRNVWVSAVLWTLAAGCSTSDSSSGLTLTSFADQYCNLIEPCCAHEGLSTSGLNCRGLLEPGPRNIMYDETVGGPCLDALRQAQSAPDFCVTLGGIPSACLRLFREGAPGGRPPGQPCQSDGDCAPAPGGEAYCGDFNTLDGGTNHLCVQTLTGTAVNAPCVGDTTGALTTGFFIKEPDSPPPGPAYLCDLSQGVICDRGTRICTASYGVGSPCTGDSHCVSTAYCELSQPPMCVARSAIGTACANSESCISTAYCDGSHCAARLAIGAACTTSQIPPHIPCDPAGFCDLSMQTCTALLGVGAACADDTSCLSSFCHKGSCTASRYDSNVVMTCGPLL